MSSNVAQRPKPKKILTFQNFKLGLIVSLLSQPFEVIKTSTIMSLKTKNQGFTSVIRRIFEMEGFRGFFRGGLIGMGKSTLSAGIFFTGLENTHALTHELRNIKYIPVNAIDFMNACISRTLSTVITNPIVVVKTRFEVVGNNQYSSIKDAVSSMYKREGLKGFYTGILPTLYRDVPYAGIQYSTYKFTMEQYSKYILKGGNPYDSSVLVSIFGAASATFAVLMTYPFENLRVRLQCHDLESMANVRLSSLTSMVKTVYTEEGVRGFYLGFVPRLLKKVTSGAVLWVLYENMRRENAAH
jgi:hypothetical protein